MIFKESSVMHCMIWCHLYNFKKREKHHWSRVTLSKVAGWKWSSTLKQWQPDSQSSPPEPLRFAFRSKVSFDEHIQCILNKIRKIIGLKRKLGPTIPRAALLTIYKSLPRLPLDYSDVICDWASTKSFQNNLKVSSI